MQVEECVTTNVILPRKGTVSGWDSIITAPEIKTRLLHTALLALHVRPRLPFEVTALHGLVLLYGPPGTGKTTLARAVAHELSGLVLGEKARLIEINPHGLMSAEHGQSQQKVFELLCEHIPLLADDRLPTVVVLDEVESMTVSRSAASLSANPADVHRATDAVLAALDRNAVEHPHLVTIATSNFTEALDEAFKSRADAAILVPLPDEVAIAAILTHALRGFASVFPNLRTLADDSALAKVAQGLVGSDGRQVRKFITDAMARRRETVLDPGSLTLADLEQAIPATSRSIKGGHRHAAA
jgi:SpoVK/Ycf46/Vps4 family AAA+-type ATPase